MTTNRADARDRLATLAAPTAREMRQGRRRREVRAALSSLRLSLLAVPVPYLLAVSSAAWLGLDARVPAWSILPLWLLPPAWLVARAAWRASRRTVSDVAALAEIDRQQLLQDRLSAAREFVDAERPDGFMLAAIEDAERRIAAAAAAREPVPAGVPPLRKRVFAHAALAVLLLWSADRIAAAPGIGATAEPEPRAELARIDGDLTAVNPPAPAPRPTANRSRPGDPQPGEDAAADDRHTFKSERAGRDPHGAGRSAAARNVAGGGSDRGQPSRQAQSTQALGTPKAKRAESKAERPQDDAARDKPPKPQEQSGGTEGTGSGRGSSRSPTATPWDSKDQVVAEQQKELDHDEEVFDDTDESDSRGGLQPTLRNKKPPVNRDLTTAFGASRPSQDANGRGTGGDRKKQRGVPQLILGVTFPDHLTGPPNPGRTKITQERIEPQMRESERLPAENRGQRTTKTGPMTQRLLTPWMQDVVRAFFLSSRDPSRSE